MIRLISPFCKALRLIIVFALLTFACSQVAEQNKEESKTFTEAEEKIIEDISKVIDDLPPPTVVPVTIKNIGAKYHPEIVNSLNRLGSYMVNNDKAALNLGIYAADIGYLAVYNRMQESLEHLEACQELAEHLGVSTAFDLQSIKSFEANMSNTDSLTTLLNETITLTEGRLSSSDNLNMAALVITGGFLEGIFLAVEIVKLYPRGQISEDTRDEILLPLEKLILSQEQPLIDIIQMLEDLPQDETIEQMISDLSILKLLYDADKKEIEKHQNEVNFHLSEKFLIDINEEIIRIRSKIVQ